MKKYDHAKIEKKWPARHRKPASGVAGGQKGYNHKAIEGKWQKIWSKNNIYKTADKGKGKFYVLDMFPYPSGEGLHVGHPKGYIATDIISRMKRMQGHNVLHPMGFDAFGLPAEQYAIKTKTNPAVAVAKNVARYKKQLEILGLDYDWSREVVTTDPGYYKWTQWIFLKLLEKGLAYESWEPINWCPVDKTGLANEDIENGRCERCGALVEKRPMRQWVLRITDYADRMLADLDATDYVMPHVIDKVNPPQKDKKTIERKNVHAIIFDPKQNKYLIIRNKKFGWDTVVIGGIENGEDPVSAAKREIAEETGYVDLEFKRLLGGEVKASYFAKHKDVNRVAYSTCAYFELASDKRVPFEEGGENEGNEIMWIDEADFVPGKMVNSELPIWLERLNVEIGVGKDGVPCFTEIRGSSGWRKDARVVERDAIVAVVKHWSKDEYIGLKWKKVAWRTLLTGGPEGDQTLEEAALAEIKEETGYENVRFKGNLGVVDGKFFHGPKGENRNGHFHVMSFELKDGKRRALTPEEQENHEVVWVAKDEMAEFITPATQKYAWETLFLGKPSSYIELCKPLLDWPASIKESQRNWIGRSEGVNFICNIKDLSYEVRMYNSVPQSYHAETFTVIAHDHPLIPELIKSMPNQKEILQTMDRIKKKKAEGKFDAKEDLDGIFTGRYIESFADTGRDLPIWIASYVISDYGTGIVNGSAHDERDFAFAKKHGIPLRVVCVPEDPVEAKKVRNFDYCYARDPKGIMLEPVKFKGRRWGEVRQDVINHIVSNNLGEKKINYKLRDWVFSRQRYWGEPIPVMHDKNGKVIPLKEKDLPLELPKVTSYEPTDNGESPLAAISKWINVKVGKGKNAETLRRESNTMPQWAGSSWYYLRFMDPKNKKALVDPKKERYWNEVDLYVGGAEHATRHLIYARFWHKFLYDIGVVSTTEPFRKLQSVGLIMAADGRKMSKRWGNVINPDEIVATYGADTLRVYEMFMGPFDQAVAWSSESIIGARRFIERVWNLQHKIGKGKAAASLEILLNQSIKKVGEDIEAMAFNTAISSLMILVNAFEKEAIISKKDYQTLLALVAPFAPHVTEELWTSVGGKGSVHKAAWPAFDPNRLLHDTVTIAIQINGKVRGEMRVARDIAKDVAIEAAKEVPGIGKWLLGKRIAREIYVPGRLVNIVVD